MPYVATAETIIGNMYSKWIGSYRDLPLKLNQWAHCVTVRAENHSALDGSVIAQLRFEAYVGVPFGVVGVDVGYLIDKFVVVVRHSALRIDFGTFYHSEKNKSTLQTIFARTPRLRTG